MHESEGYTDQTSSTTCWAGELQVVGGATKRAVWCVDVSRKEKGKAAGKAKQTMNDSHSGCQLEVGLVGRVVCD